MDHILSPNAMPIAFAEAFSQCELENCAVPFVRRTDNAGQPRIFLARDGIDDKARRCQSGNGLIHDRFDAVEIIHGQSSLLQFSNTIPFRLRCATIVRKWLTEPSSDAAGVSRRRGLRRRADEALEARGEIVHKFLPPTVYV